METSRSIDDNSKDRCACLAVRYTPKEVGNGLMHERWICDFCGSEFMKKSSVGIKEQRNMETSRSMFNEYEELKITESYFLDDRRLEGWELLQIIGVPELKETKVQDQQVVPVVKTECNSCGHFVNQPQLATVERIVFLPTTNFMVLLGRKNSSMSLHNQVIELSKMIGIKEEERSRLGKEIEKREFELQQAKDRNMILDKKHEVLTGGHNALRARHDKLESDLGKIVEAVGSLEVDRILGKQE